jgi:benzodiazapine receptor
MFGTKNQSSFIQKLFPCLILCLGGGWLTGLVTQHGVKEWYPHLIKPYGTPVDVVFPIVWSILYIAMAIALALLWTSHTTGKKVAFLFFTTQLILNFIWSWLFFYLQEPGLALVDVVLLWFSILLTISFFWPHTRYGSYLLLPYLVWVTYAFYLNLFIWIYN